MSLRKGQGRGEKIDNWARPAGGFAQLFGDISGLDYARWGTGAVRRRAAGDLTAHEGMQSALDCPHRLADETGSATAWSLTGRARIGLVLQGHQHTLAHYAR